MLCHASSGRILNKNVSQMIYRRTQTTSKQWDEKHFTF